MKIWLKLAESSRMGGADDTEIDLEGGKN